MRFKLDENLPQDLVRDLQNLGHDSDSVITENLAGADDETVVRAAAHARRILLTLDKGIPRLFQQTREGGVVLFRPDSLGRKAVLSFIRSRLPLLLSIELERRVTVVGSTRIRVR
jgi:predicted nuclease of predicted toxin-antitoxin system